MAVSRTSVVSTEIGNGYVLSVTQKENIMMLRITDDEGDKSALHIKITNLAIQDLSELFSGLAHERGIQ